FSSRRRHTRLVSDWSSDVCSSDLKQRHEQLPGVRMPRANTAEMPDDRSAGEIEVTEGVEQLVADELVGIAQAAMVEHAVAADHRSEERRVGEEGGTWGGAQWDRRR